MMIYELKQKKNTNVEIKKSRRKIKGLIKLGISLNK